MIRVLLLSTLAASAAIADDDSPELRRGDPRTDVLGPEDVHRYSIDLDADRFVYLEATQLTVDVMLEVRGPSGERVAATDITALGPEPLQFVTEEEGRHHLFVSPFEGGAGKYAVELLREERAARSPKDTVDQLMAPFDFDDRPGGIVAVIREGEVDFARAYGQANLTDGIPITEETVFNIGSVSKQFAGIFFAMKAESGELSLNDDVRQYMPEFPDFGRRVTLHHVLTHRSGYREAYGVLGLGGRSVDGDILERQDAIDVVVRQTALQFPPGQWYLYNSTAYVILTEIAERITDTPYPDWMLENVFRPLGMDDTTIERVPGEVIPNAAVSYTLSDQGFFREDFEAYAYYGATDVYTTVHDLARWMGNFRSGEVGGAGAIERMVAPVTLPSGMTQHYGLGIGTEDHDGLPRYSHGGATGGYRAYLAYYPTLDAGVVVLGNTGAVDTRRIGDAAAKAFFADEWPEAVEESDPPRPGDVSVTHMTWLERPYRVRGIDFVTLSLRAGVMYANERPLEAHPGMAFKDGEAWFHFTEDGAASVSVPGRVRWRSIDSTRSPREMTPPRSRGRTSAKRQSRSSAFASRATVS